MSHSQSKLIANLLVIIGVGLCATFGAQLTPKTLNAVTVEQIKVNKISDQLTKVEIEAPADRIKVWWTLSALPFSGGLLLILLGSTWASRLHHAELSQDPSVASSNTNATLDSEESLQLIIQTIQELKTLLSNNDHSHMEAVKQKIEQLILSPQQQ